MQTRTRDHWRDEKGNCINCGGRAGMTELCIYCEATRLDGAFHLTIRIACALIGLALLSHAIHC